MFEYFQKEVHGDVISNRSGQGMVHMKMQIPVNLQHSLHPHWKLLTSPQRWTWTPPSQKREPMQQPPNFNFLSGPMTYQRNLLVTLAYLMVQSMVLGIPEGQQDNASETYPFWAWEPQGWQGVVVWLINYAYYNHAHSRTFHIFLLLRHLCTRVTSFITLGVRCISGLFLCVRYCCDSVY